MLLKSWKSSQCSVFYLITHLHIPYMLWPKNDSYFLSDSLISRKFAFPKVEICWHIEDSEIINIVTAFTISIEEQTLWNCNVHSCDWLHRKHGCGSWYVGNTAMNKTKSCVTGESNLIGIREMRWIVYICNLNRRVN